MSETVPDYFAQELNATEKIAYKAAGIAFFKKVDTDIHILVGCEIRKGEPGINFIGGKRDPGETHPLETAIREVSEETLGLITSIADFNYHGVLWIQSSKYVLFLYELFNDINYPLKYSEIKGSAENPELDSLAWISLEASNLSSGFCKIVGFGSKTLKKYRKMHHFVKSNLLTEQFNGLLEKVGEIPTVFEIHAKVRDNGAYFLRNKNDSIVESSDGYPPAILNVATDTFDNDYIHLKIDIQTGKVLNWKVPSKLTLK